MADPTTLTRNTLLKWHPRWNDRDRATLEAMIDEFDAASFTVAPSGYPHVKVRDAEGNLIMDVARGRVYLKAARRWDGSVPYDEDGDSKDHVYLLSTSREHSEGKSAPDPTGGHPTCPDCFLCHPVGECDR